MTARRVLVVVAAMVVASAATVDAQEPVLPQEPTGSALLKDTAAAALDARAARIAAQLRCPVCSGQSVLESNSSIAQEMQEVIRERLDEGEDEAQILAYFVSSYGDWIILKPRAIGLNILVYVLPAIALVLGAVWVVAKLNLWSRTTPEATGRGEDGLSDDDERWLAEAVRD